MATQDNRSTQYVLFAVQVDYKDYKEYSGDWEFKERSFGDHISYDEYEKLLCKACRKVWNEGDGYTNLPDDTCLNEGKGWQHECKDEAFFYYNIKQKLTVESVGVFFTAKACQQHIDENYYHYENPQVYGIAAWRNPEMVAIMQHLIALSGKELPSHYV